MNRQITSLISMCFLTLSIVFPKHRDIKLATTNKRRRYLVSEPKYHATKWFSESLLAIEMKNE